MSARPALAAAMLGSVALATCTPEATSAVAPASAPTASAAAVPPATVDAGPPPQGCDALECTGSPGPLLRTALRNRAATARECYESLLRHSPTERGRIVVFLRLASDGSVCSRELLERTFDAGEEFERCVLERFAASFPSPDGGCLQVAIPLSFVPKPSDAGADGAD